ncbi:hypothetical protein [Mycobacterium interjectum]|uniref:hypothetical protein n=1 Tax=Mycobacterium interjectum TaxID=33895 RepID=UPI00082AE182|nr:hypothetical protein [Mycobacterium interjectum]MCV7089454.1 hypothetical protein [Mycobacterium interjectum]
MTTWIATMRDGSQIDITADEVITDAAGHARFVNDGETVRAIICAGSWLRVEAADAGLVIHQPPAPVPPPLRGGVA